MKKEVISKYYSQCGQDKFLNEKIFKGKKNGIFVDIGANDGINFSNTYFFEKELSWKGICIEPLKGAFEKLEENRNSININACASNEDKQDCFLSISGYGEMLSGLKSKYDPQHLQRIFDTSQKHGCVVEEIQVQCYDINKILKKYSFEKIDLLSIDTEGNELEILANINYDTTHIKVIAVENNYHSTGFNQFLFLKGFLKVRTLDHDEVYLNLKDFKSFKKWVLQLDILILRIKSFITQKMTRF